MFVSLYGHSYALKLKSINAAVPYLQKSLHKKVSDFAKLILCVFNFTITSLYYLCFTYRETALCCATELVVQWLKGIKQWLWYFKYWLGGIFNSFLIMKQTNRKTLGYTTLKHWFPFLFWVDPTEMEKNHKNLTAFSLFDSRRKIKQA